jgi:hypothetical protein
MDLLTKLVTDYRGKLGVLNESPKTNVNQEMAELNSSPFRL